MSDFANPGLVTTEVVVPAVPSEKRQPRLTVYAAVLVGIFLVLGVATFRFNAIEHPVRHVIHYIVSVRIFSLVVQWILFYLAYRGIRASNLTLSEAMGRGVSSGWDIWDYFVDGMAIIFLIGVSTALLYSVEPFRHTGAVYPRTWIHFVLSLAFAVSAGYTEEVIFRGFLFQQFKMFWNPIAGLLAQAVIFAVAHGGNQSFTQFLSRFVAGCIFGHYALKRSSLWPCVIGHTILDTFALLFPFILRTGH